MNKALLLLLALGTITFATEVCGGYGEIAISPRIEEIAKFAAKVRENENGGSVKVIKVISAYQQVVAGINFKINMLVKTGSDEKTIEAIVWQRLDNSIGLTDWKEAK